MFSTLTDKFNAVIRTISGQGKISESNVREAMADVRTALLEADVHYEVVETFTKKVIDEALGTKVLESLEPGQQFIKVVYDQLVELLGEKSQTQQDEKGNLTTPSPIFFVNPGPTIIMMCGLQGSGKTTTCGKLAAYLKKRGKSVMLCAADLQRPAAVHQLEVLVGQVNELKDAGAGKVAFYSEPDKVAEYGKAVGAAVTVCKNAVAAARAQKIDVVILDTAGRLHINDALMDELRQVNSALNPHQVYLVIDAMTGQDAVNSAKAFNSQLELDGCIITKFDSDTRGGAAISVKSITGKPIKFIGVGEKLENLEEFHADRIASRILGMGDVVSLVEKAQAEVSQAEAEALQEKMAKGQLTMEDFLSQLKAIRRMGPMKSILGMLPGIGSQLKDLPLDEKQIDRTEAIINSMTKKERKDINILDNSRRRRVAKGSGVTLAEVSQLIKGFEMVSLMSKQIAGLSGMGKLKALTGMGGMDMAAMMGGRPPRMPVAAQPEKPKYKERKRRK